MTGEYVTDRLYNIHRLDNYAFKNIYYFNWESDLLVITKSGYVWEIEVKISRSDFKADFNKRIPGKLINGKIITYKHEAIKTGIYGPNRFYFAAPAGLIKPEELPSYCGLIEDPFFHTAKKAPIIHKRDVINYKALFHTTYWRHHRVYNELINTKRRDI